MPDILLYNIAKYMDGENIKRIIFINDKENERTIKIQYKDKPKVADTTFDWCAGGTAITNIEDTITFSNDTNKPLF
jgi:hypothetical protein